MNSICVPVKASPDVQKLATEQMLHFVNVAGSIADWGKLQARVLFESVLSWQKEELIPLEKWEAKFQLSKVKATTRSGQAFKDYLRINDFEEVTNFIA
jgi:hypothetical protein